MSNREKIGNKAKELELKIGCWNDTLELLSKKELDKVLGNMKFEEDTDVKIKRKDYVVEIDIVDNEIDFNVLTRAEFINRYGDERYDNQ